VVAIPIQRSTLNRVVFILLSLATGAMLGNAVVNLVPESFENASTAVVWSLSLVGIMLCFILYKVLNVGCHHATGGHCRDEHCKCEAKKLCKGPACAIKSIASFLREAAISFGPPVATIAAYELLTAGVGLDRTPASGLVCAAVLLWFVVNKVRRSRHNHGDNHGDHHGHSHSEHTPLSGAPAGHIHHTGWMSLVSHAMDNFMDGVLIAVAYQVSPEVGIATTLAIVLHEIPMEFGGFGVLINAGFSRWAAIGINFGSAMVATSGTLLTLWLGSRVQGLSVWLTPLCAAIVLNITLSGLMPQLHKETRWKYSLLQVAIILVGTAAIFTVHCFFPE